MNETQHGGQDGGIPEIGICEFSTVDSTFEEDLVNYRAAGAVGIGVCEYKIGEDAVVKLKESGLRATFCIPAISSILPVPIMQPVMPGPEDPEERIEALCASVHRLAQFDPVCVQFLTGPAGEHEDAYEIVRQGIRAVADAGKAAGVPIALEPMHPDCKDVWSWIHTIPDALEIIGGDDVGILLDTWHVNDPDGIAPHVDRILGVHMADRREPTRSVFDRALPGTGSLDLVGIVRVLVEGGYTGSYEVEIFSDNGKFGNHFPDSLWDMPADELADRAVASMRGVWDLAMANRS